MVSTNGRLSVIYELAVLIILMTYYVVCFVRVLVPEICDTLLTVQR